MTSRIETGVHLAIITAAHTAKLAAVEYSKKPADPQRYWNYQEAHWQLNGYAMGLAESDLVVPNVPWTEDQMRQFMGKGLRSLLAGKHDILFYLPEVVSGKDGLPLLDKAYPWMKLDNEANVGIQNIDRDGTPVSLSGHLRTEVAIDAPYTKTNEDQAAGILARLGRRGHTINTYVEAGNQGKLLTGKYLDESKTWIRVMLSRAHGGVVGACFDPDGYCNVRWSLEPDLAYHRLSLEPDLAYDRLGVRSVGV